ncbi:MFS transporter [Desulfovulcanus sp.]
MTQNHNKEIGQFKLLTTKKFAPFFWTQFSGAFNDNVFRNAIIILIAYKAGVRSGIDSDILVNIAAGLFILPFFLFSALAGQISDRYEKSMLIRRIKMAEIIIMAGATLAFYFNNIIALLFLLFLMGAQSTFFGPVKYSIIPQHLEPDKIVGGNALVGMGTFIAILLGTITGGVIIVERGNLLIGIILWVVAICGWLASCFIPDAPSNTPHMKLDLNPLIQPWKTISHARKDRSVFFSVLGISWFWFLGSAYLTQIPNFTKEVLKGDGSVVVLLLSMFSVGIGIGSLMCEKLSGKKVELGLVPLGSIGLSLFGADLFLAYDSPNVQGLMGISEFIKTDGSIRVLCDLVLIGIFGGFYIVPLNAFIQIKTEPQIRGRVIAANNILNALFMVISALAGALLLGVANLSIPRFFLIIAIANMLVAIYIYFAVPEFIKRFFAWTGFKSV